MSKADRIEQFVNRIARMKAYRHEMPEDGEDAMMTMNQLIEQARDLTEHE